MARKQNCAAVSSHLGSREATTKKIRAAVEPLEHRTLMAAQALLTTSDSSQGTPPFVALGSSVYFITQTSTNDLKLWKTTGTAGGTSLVKDLATTGAPSQLLASSAKLYFTAGTSLWQSDGTTAGTTVVSGVSNVDQMVLDNSGNLFFNTIVNSGYFDRLWEYSGSGSPAAVVSSQYPGGSTPEGPRNPINVNGSIFFSEAVSPGPYQLFRYNGTANSITQITNQTYLSSIGQEPYAELAVGSKLYFDAPDYADTAGGAIDHTHLYVVNSDGTGLTTAGLTPNNVDVGSITPAAVGSTVYFVANDGSNNQQQIWKTDGTTAGTSRVTSINANGSSGSDGTSGLNSQNLFAAGSNLYFDGDFGSSAGFEIGVISAASPNGALLKDISPGSTSGTANSSYPYYFAAVGSTLYFDANTSATQAVLYQTTGTTASTTQAAVIEAGDTFGPFGLTGIGSTLYFDSAAPGTAANYSLPFSYTAGAVITAPTANSQSVSTGQNAAVGITLTGADTNSPPLSLTYTVTASPTHGTLTGTAPNLTYTPAAGYFGADSFQFTDSNGSLSSSAATVTITVVGTPTANAQSVSVNFNTAKAVTLTGSDPNSPARSLTYTVAASPSHGTLSGTAPNLTYTPAAGYHGADSFTFTVNNGTNTSAAATVTLTVAAGTPTANGQTVAVAFNTAKALTLTGTDPDSPALSLTYSVVTSAAHGTLSGTAPNLTYTPAAGYHGADSFTFTVNNGTNTSTAATVTLNVATGTPTANAQSVNVAHNTATPVTLSASDPDAPALSLTYTVATAPAHGTLTGTAPNLTYTPAAGYAGSDLFTFTVSNGTNTSTAATVSLTVAAAAPTANAQSVSTAQNTAKPITLTGSDPNVPVLSLTYSVTAAPSHGTLTGTAPNLTYTPATGYTGGDSFQFTDSNGSLTSAPATVSISVQGAATTTGLTSNFNPSVFGQNVTFTATVAVVAPGTGTPTGSVQFAINGTPYGSPVNLSGAGVATIDDAALAVGSATITAVYTPSGGGFVGSNGGTSQVVNAANTTTSIGTSGSPSGVGQDVTFTATVAAAAPGAGTPTGTVQFSVDGNPFGTPVTLIGGVATIHDSALAVGSHSITAVYAGSTNFTGSFTAAAATQIVQSSTVASTVGISWGTAGTATLLTNADGLRLLPAGRSTDLNWLGINKLSITLSFAAPLAAADVSVTGTTVANYGPVTVSGSGTLYTITLAQPINATDRVTITIGNAAITTFTRRLDVLPGDVNDDGAVNTQDAVLVRNMIIGSAPVTVFGDIDGNGVVDMTDYNLVRARTGTSFGAAPVAVLAPVAPSPVPVQAPVDVVVTTLPSASPLKTRIAGRLSEI